MNTTHDFDDKEEMPSARICRYCGLTAFQTRTQPFCEAEN